MRRVHRPITATRTLHTRRTMQVLHSTDTYDRDRGIDWIAVERAAAGTLNPHTLNAAETIATVHFMTDNGLSESTIAARLHMDKRRVTRIKERRTRQLRTPTPGQAAGLKAAA